MKPLVKFGSVAALLLVAQAACSDSSSSNTLVRGGPSDGPPLDHPPLEVQRVSAAPRRLSVDQWRGTFAVVFGNDVAGKPIEWRNTNGTSALSATIARSLGEPDYIVTTDEALEPSLLYSKFADDAARSACGQALDADLAKADGKTRALLRFVEPADVTNAAAVDTNLRYLKLRFHGVYLPKDDAAVVKPLHDLLNASANASTQKDARLKGRDAWLTVCVALATAPEFHAY